MMCTLNGATSACVGLILLTPALSAAATVSAIVDWQRRVELSTPVAGTVDAVSARPGQHVAPEEALVTLVKAPFEAQLSAARATARGLSPARLRAAAALERTEALHAQTLSSDKALATARQTLTEADAAHEHALALQRSAALSLDGATLRAPFAGVVLEVPAAKGRTVHPARNDNTLIVMAATDTLIATVTLGAAALAKLSLGEDITVRGPFGTVSGQVHALYPEPALESGADTPRYEVEVAFAPPTGHPIRVGYEVSLTFPD